MSAVSDLFDEPPKKKDRSKKQPAGGSRRAAGGQNTRGDAAAANYTAKDIEVLEGLEPVRRRPGMYIGGTDERALHHLAAEVLDNAMDEVVAGHASWVEFDLSADGGVTVRDNGRGIPVRGMSKLVWKTGRCF